jgi:hypothetical protein
MAGDERTTPPVKNRHLSVPVLVVVAKSLRPVCRMSWWNFGHVGGMPPQPARHDSSKGRRRRWRMVGGKYRAGKSPVKKSSDDGMRRRHPAARVARLSAARLSV